MQIKNAMHDHALHDVKHAHTSYLPSHSERHKVTALNSMIEIANTQNDVDIAETTIAWCLAAAAGIIQSVENLVKIAVLQ